jgi:hypothetical protein
VRLLRTDDRRDAVDAFVDRAGTRVGLSAVLDDLSRQARVVRVPAPAASWGFRWDSDDTRTERWWPQGITTSAAAAGADDHGRLEGRSVLVTSAYAHEVRGVAPGARLTFVDVTDRGDVRYRHVLLVEPFLRDDGSVDVRPLRVHAGGVVWYGDHLHVAGTTRGLTSFRLQDLTRVGFTRDRTRLQLRGDGIDAFGYRYVLPVRFTYTAQTADGTQAVRYSFASVDRSRTPHVLVAGEYGRGDLGNRLVGYDLDPATSLLRSGGDGWSEPSTFEVGGVPGMQGATVVDGTWFVTTSCGRFRLGSVWVGRPGALVEHRRQLPVGPEGIAYAPGDDALWSLSEYPGARYVFAMPRSRFTG